MKPSWIDKNLPLLADLAFALYLSTEILLAHTVLSQLCMLLFFGVTAVYVFRRKQLFFSWWMIAGALVILWGVTVSFAWAIDRGASLSMVKTLVINLVFFFVLLQYLLLQGNLLRYFTVFVLLVTAMSAVAVALILPITVEWTRAGNLIGVNPNWLGMLAASAIGFCLILAAQRKKALWLLPILILAPTVALTKSTKGAVLAAILFVILLLILYPKYWYLKLAGLLVLGAAAFYFLIYQENVLSNTVFHRFQQLAHCLLNGVGTDESFTNRGSLASIALEAFRNRPWTGWGIDCFRFLEGAEQTYSHCNFTELLVSGGVPLLILYYGAQLAAVVLAARSLYRTRAKHADLRNERNIVGAMMIFLLAQVAMDAGMVSYYDRTMAVFPVLLIASTRLLEKRDKDGERLFACLRHPEKLFVWLAEHGWFRRMDDEKYLKRFYRARMGKRLHLNPPVTMNEKLQWLKLHDRYPQHARLVDKLAVRDFVSEKIGSEYLVELLGSWDDASNIDFSKLPERFVLKCSHNSGGVIVCKDKSGLNLKAARKSLRRQLKRSYYAQGREWLYKDVPPRVLCEAFLGSEDGKLPDDYKFFCFDGAVRAVCVCTNRKEKHADYYFFDRDFNRLAVNEATVNLPPDFKLAKPARFEQMRALAETLGAGIKHVRVDLYDAEAGIKFGEMTFFDQSGFADDYVGDGDRVMGDFLQLEEQA